MLRFEIEITNVCGFTYNVRQLHYMEGRWYYAGFGKFCHNLTEVNEYISECSKSEVM